MVNETREELGLSPNERLDPFALANNLEIPVIPLSELARIDTGAKYLYEVEPEVFSALTILLGSARQIVYNDAHSPGRVASNITHEIAHGLLLHEPRPALDASGCRDWNDEIEHEAEWLAGALLIPDQAALFAVMMKRDRRVIADQFGVSEKMVAYRTQVTGAYARASRAIAFRERMG